MAKSRAGVLYSVAWIVSSFHNRQIFNGSFDLSLEFNVLLDCVVSIG